MSQALSKKERYKLKNILNEMQKALAEIQLLAPELYKLLRKMNGS